MKENLCSVAYVNLNGSSEIDFFCKPSYHTQYYCQLCEFFKPAASAKKCYHQDEYWYCCSEEAQEDSLLSSKLEDI